MDPPDRFRHTNLKSNDPFKVPQHQKAEEIGRPVTSQPAIGRGEEKSADEPTKLSGQIEMNFRSPEDPVLTSNSNQGTNTGRFKIDRIHQRWRPRKKMNFFKSSLLAEDGRPAAETLPEGSWKSFPSATQPTVKRKIKNTQNVSVKGDNIGRRPYCTILVSLKLGSRIAGPGDRRLWTTFSQNF